jgi:branched-chain amino acid transport system substrate-binding protein
MRRDPGARAGITVDAERRAVMTNPAFFARDPALLEHARRALTEGPPVLRYYCRSADHGLLRVTIETADTERGRTARLDAQESEPPWALTTREHEVLTHLAGGMTNPEIAVSLGCARRTAATHVEHVLAKLAAPSRAAAAALAMAEDALLVPLPEAATFEVTALGRVTRPGCVVTAARRLSPPAKRPIRLGAVYPTDGPRRLDALAMRRGAALAVHEFNARGGIAGRRLEHIVTEVSGDTDDDIMNALRHLQALDVDAITLGNVSPRHDVRAITEAARYRAPLLHSMVSPAITEHVHDNPGSLGQTFQVCATETAYASGFVRTLDLLTLSGQWQPPNRRLAVVARRSTLDPGHLAALNRLTAEQGWELDAILPIEDTGVPWDDVVRAIAASDPAAIFVCTYIEDELRRFLQGVKQLGLRSLLYTVWTPSIPQFADRLGPLAERLLWSTVIGTYGDPLNAPFMRGFLRAFGEDPGSGSAAIHYDMIHMLAGAWSALDRPWDFDAVVRHLRQSVHRGVAGPYFFGGRGQRALVYPDDTPDASLAHAHLVHQIHDGRSQVIAPAEIAHSRFRPPEITPLSSRRP